MVCHIHLREDFFYLETAFPILSGLYVCAALYGLEIVFFQKICVAYCLFLFHDDLKRYIEISLAKIFSVKAASAEVEMFFLSLQSKLSKRNISEEMSIDHI